MSFEKFMNKVRYLDNLTAKWLLRHFYFLFFQIVLVLIFLFWFVNLLNVIDINFNTRETSNVESILKNQSINLSILTFLMLLNSFWLLYLFNGLQRLTSILKDISYNINRLRLRNKD